MRVVGKSTGSSSPIVIAIVIILLMVTLAPTQTGLARGGPPGNSAAPSAGPADGNNWTRTSLWTAFPSNTNVPASPAWLAYDNATHAFYVAVDSTVSGAFGSVDVVPSGTASVSESIPVGLIPFGVAFDYLSGNIFVTNTGSDNVSVLAGGSETVTATFAVGSSPHGVAYDFATNTVYVADAGSNEVQVFDATSLAQVATVPVGLGPVGVVYDPVNGDVYVANSGSNTVSVISGSADQVISTIPVGQNPYALAVDTTSNTIYVTNPGSGNVSVVSASDGVVVASIDLSTIGTLAGTAYDPQDGTIWVDGLDTVAVINGAANEVVQILQFDPEGAAYDSDTGQVCVTNAANATYACFSGPAPARLFSVTFTETGLPIGSSWQVTLQNSTAATETLSSTTTTIVFNEPDGTYSYALTGGPNSYTGSPEGGRIIVDGANVTTSIQFTPIPTTPLTFTESGLPNGTAWTVSVGLSTSESSTNDAITFQLQGSGTIEFEVAPVPRYSADPASGSTYLTQGTPQTVSITFSIVYLVNLTESGLPGGTPWTLILHGSIYTSTLSYLDIWEENGTYPFETLNTSSWQTTDQSGSITVNGSGVTRTIDFSYAYPVTFTAIGLPAGATWYVNFTGTLASPEGSLTSGGVASTVVYTFSNDSATFEFSLPNGSYTYHVASNSPRWNVTTSEGNLSLSGHSPPVVYVGPPIAPGGGGGLSLMFLLAGFLVAIVGAIGAVGTVAYRRHIKAPSLGTTRLEARSERLQRTAAPTGDQKAVAPPDEPESMDDLF